MLCAPLRRKTFCAGGVIVIPLTSVRLVHPSEWSVEREHSDMGKNKAETTVRPKQEWKYSQKTSELLLSGHKEPISSPSKGFD